MKNMQKVPGIILTVALLIMAGCGTSETPQEKFQKEVSHEMAEMQKKIENLKSSYNEKLGEMHKKFDEQAAAAQKQYNEALADLSKKQDNRRAWKGLRKGQVRVQVSHGLQDNSENISTQIGIIRSSQVTGGGGGFSALAAFLKENNPA